MKVFTVAQQATVHLKQQPQLDLSQLPGEGPE